MHPPSPFLHAVLELAFILNPIWTLGIQCSPSIEQIIPPLSFVLRLPIFKIECPISIYFIFTPLTLKIAAISKIIPASAMLKIAFFLTPVFISVSVVLCNFQDFLLSDSAFIHFDPGGKNSTSRIANVGVGDNTFEHFAAFKIADVIINKAWSLTRDYAQAHFLY